MDRFSIFSDILDENMKTKFEIAVKTLEDGIQTRHIWNVDFENAKYQLSRAWDRVEGILYTPLSDLWYRSDGSESWKMWEDNDPRHNIPTHQLSYVPGYLKKLKTIKAPELKTYIKAMEQAAELAGLLKAAKPFIVKGRKPSENPVEKDVTNTGLCPVCMKRQKLTFNGTVVAHGYTISHKWSGRNGMCLGFGYKAWELSPDGAIAFKKSMENYLSNLKKRVTNLIENKFPTLSETIRVREGFGEYKNELRTFKRGTPEYERIRHTELFSNENAIRYITSDIESVNTRINNWKPQPLMYGGAETQERWKSKLLKKEGQ